MLNYVILTIHSFHHYSMWDFTHTCNPTISPSHVSLCLSMGFMTSLWGHKQVLHAPFCLMGLSLHQCIVHGTPCVNPTPLPNGHFPSLVHHPCDCTCQSRTSFILYGNLTPHHYLALLAIILLCWAFFKIVCAGFMGLLGAICHPRSNCKKDPPCSICERASSTHTPFPLQLQNESR